MPLHRMDVDDGPILSRQDAALNAYEPDFGLLESPFTLTPNPRYLFESRSHSTALEQVAHALPRHEPLIVITGAVGTGKTMLCHIVAQRRDARTFVAIISTPPTSGDDLLRQVLDEFGVLPRESRLVAQASHFELVRTLQQFLASLVPLNAQAVIVIDEAHRLSIDVFDQLRMLSNLETETRKLLQIILVGEPELDGVLEQPQLRPLRQRVTRRHELQPLMPAEVRGYIERRLWVAHQGDEPSWRVPFTDSAMAAIAKLSGGVPRVVNVLCDRALERAHQLGLARVDVKAALSAARTLQFPVPLALRVREHRWYLAAAAALVVVSTIGWWAVRTHVVPWPLTSRAQSAPTNITSSSPAGAVPAATAVAPVPTPEATPPAADASPAPSAATDRFVVVVSSFRTAARAASAAEEISRLDLPAFTRATSSGWQQVVVGPYATREGAAQAQERLIAAHLTDARIVSSASESSASERDPAEPRPDQTPRVAPPPAPEAPGASTNTEAPRRSEDVLERASVMARRPDVRGLVQLRAQLAARARGGSADPNELEGLLKQVDGYLNEARRRQLEIDARRRQEAKTPR
jgi:type II secretory pathway predicted ATPase ExeA